MSDLTLDRAWLEPGFVPASLYEGPFRELEHRPRFDEVAQADISDEETDLSLPAFGEALAHALDVQVRGLRGKVHLLASGGYDSRALAFLLEKHGKEPLYVTDGTQEPSCSRTLDFLGVPEERRYVHDLSKHDPYGLVRARIEGWAPLYMGLRFAPAAKTATLITGLGGGEWFSYPAADWHRGKKPRTDRSTIRGMWLDCWPQFSIVPDVWADGYKAALHPFTTVVYATVAARARREWLHEGTGYPTLDAVRAALLDALDPELKTLGWEPHRYDWRLSTRDKQAIDKTARESWLWREFGKDWGRPSLMEDEPHACLMAGFARWCDRLIEDGAVIA